MSDHQGPFTIVDNRAGCAHEAIDAPLSLRHIGPIPRSCSGSDDAREAVDSNALELMPCRTEMRTIDIHEAKAHLFELVEQVARGESHLIAVAGRPRVMMAPVNAPQDGEAGRVRGLEERFEVRKASDRNACPLFDDCVGLPVTWVARRKSGARRTSR